MVRMSSTTLGGLTHELSLYRHSSGALVFGAGTVQWSWGLDSHHDRGSAPPDVRMQQATVNLFADMGVQPATLQAELVLATASTDFTAPLSNITFPTHGASLESGLPITITGGAADAGGGVVGGVEASVDGGASWQVATGLTSWSFDWTPVTIGAATLRSRAVDDSINLESPAAGVTVSIYVSGADLDNDGYTGPEDCNDADDTVFPGAPELCDGQDNDCGGAIDEGNPGGGGACDTGNPGVCAAGTEECLGGAIVCLQDQPTTAEVCDALDNDCDGQVDEDNPGGGAQCGVSDVGECEFGSELCQLGTFICVGNIDPTTEVCDGLDNDCDGPIDEGNPEGGGSCSTGELGVCAAGTLQCLGGALECVANLSPIPELCDGLDNDCDGSVDEGNPEAGNSCTTGQLGACAAGTEQCQGGTLECVPDTPATAETCNGIDDDCDGEVDEDNPGGGSGCTTGLSGACAVGTLQCQSGTLICVPETPSPEICNTIDDDCDDQIDEDTGGTSCATGEPGECATGTDECQGGALVCLAPSPTTELCGNGLDEDCDGEADEVDCALCLAENTFTSAAQTKRTIVRLKDAPDADRILTRGTFVLPAPGMIAPDTQEVRVRVSDGAGAYYEGTIPANQFEVSGNGSQFKFKDPTLAHDGIERAKVKIKRKDGVTTKYLFKVRGLNQPAFVDGTSAVTIRVGGWCFVDSADLCVLKGSGAKCE
jgi:hypothetical protein